MELSNNTILISGGSSGIGQSLGRAFLQLGNTVILLGRNTSNLAAAKKEGFETIVCDLSDREDIENAALYIQNHFPQINMLFNNAGVQYNYDFTEGVILPDRISMEININLTGQLLLTQLLLPFLLTSAKAVIVNTTSGLGAFPKENALVYSAGKAGMRNFTMGLRYSLKGTPISVLEFIPPVTDTNMTSGREEEKMPVDALVRQILPQLKRERKILTVSKMRFFLWIAFLFPSLAHKILSKS